ncbi:dihydropteroate synthase [Paenibacillus sp. J23TS9]|uniref:dihydropteroate synthase n=1 Tax=Paenibacillus sp. J23TS9 TaxID=2807193 RepID=UPI001B197B9A|nr:dihydropteroate synthase [Paenibacillus sp. J23TS9]GIP30678.1 dihydropteroate synthase [Paenibacillus sp. J23TS9]
MKTTIYERTYTMGEAVLELGASTKIMGILNVTPDSFSDGGRYVDPEQAVHHALQMVQEGADLIDIGGESTRPGFEPVSAEEELRRVIPVVEALHRAAPHIPISVDTYKAEVARKAIEAGAHIMNDIWGGKKDPDMLNAAAELGCPIILMHNRKDMNYSDFATDVVRDLEESVELALKAGVDEKQIILDPGIGFAKNGPENLQIMTQLDRLVDIGYPVLLATSRKKFIRTVMDLPVNDIVEGTAATVAFGIAQGCQIVRVHDVKQIKRTVMMCDAMLYASMDTRRIGS